MGARSVALLLPFSSIARMHLRRHVFVCTNHRPPGGKPACAGRGSNAVLAAMQEAVAAHPALRSTVAVTPCGCLGPCFEGPTLVVYPEGVWYAGVTIADVPELVESHLAGGLAVDRLRHEPPED
jgi:(2Fe-2S) ferredoxin